MGTVLGAVADDFTGATDLAGLLARSGRPVSLRLDVPREAPADGGPIEVIALKCRNSPAADAVSECRAALGWLREAGAQRFYWKYCSTFDSTAEGNIGPVAEMMLAELGAAQTIYCPAFPENGRSIYMGNLFVGDQPLSESPMKDHPLTPMRDSNLQRLLQPQLSGGRTGLVDWRTVAKGEDAVREALSELREDGIAHVVVDAVADADLEIIAAASSDLPLLTGGSALAMPLPDLYARQGLIEAGAEAAPEPDLPAGALLLAGSCSAMTRTQVDRYRKLAPSLKLNPAELAREGSGKALDWLAGQPAGANPLIYATDEPEQVRAAQERLGAAQAGELVESALAEMALAAFEGGIRRFIVAGGESSGAVAKALGISRLAVGREIAPGVPWTRAERAGEPLALALKSGNFGSADFFADALAQ